MQQSIHFSKVIVILLSIFIIQSHWNIKTLAQNIIVHQQLSEWEDGDPKYDADGVKNETVVWKAGPIHVINGRYSVEPGYGQSSATLIVQSGAIIKVAGKFELDTNGKLKSWLPGGRIESTAKSALKFDGITITDIRDDIGGDTNEDGSASSPENIPNYWNAIAMSGNDRDILQNCTIKYCFKIGGFGSIKIYKNHFVNLFQFASNAGFPGYSGEVVFNASPVITDNIFELRDSYGIDLRGMSPVVEGNTFKGGYTALSVGPLFMDGKAGPISGSTVITNNSFENFVSTAIEAKAYCWGLSYDSIITRTPPFNVSIRNNKITGTAKGSYGIIIDFSAKGEVVYNDVSNCGIPVRVYPDIRYSKFNGDALNGLRMNNNKFTLENASWALDSISYKYWSKGTFINAQYNYWGDPTGPEDKSNKDGLYNPNGKGIKLGNGIDYRNFIGGAMEVIPDAIRISASSSPSEPLKANSTAVFNINVDKYTLKSSLSGKITAMIKDETGMILNGSGTEIIVTNGSNSAAFPSIQITVPENSNQLKIEATLSPDGGDNAVTVYSNPLIFTVDKPKSSFSITAIHDISNGKPPDLIQDTKARIRFEFLYTFAGTGNGSIEIDLKERITGKGTVLQDLPLSTLTISPGVNQKASKEIEINLPLRDQEQVPQNELYYLITMKDDQGKISGKMTGILPIRRSRNHAGVFIAIPGMIDGSGMKSTSRQYYLTGEVPHIIIKCVYQIEKPDVTTWQIQLGPLEAVSADGTVIYSYPPTRNQYTGLSTTGTTSMETRTAGFLMPDGSPPLAPGVVKVIVNIRLIDPDKSMIVSKDRSYTIEVRNPSATVEKDIAKGQSEVSFDQVPAKITFSSNSSSGGKATAHEFNSPFNSPSYNLSHKSSQAAKELSEGLYTKLIPLNRYWSIYDNLDENSFKAEIQFTYDPAVDFPFSTEFNEDSLVVTSLNPNNGQLELRNSKLDKVNHRLTTDYLKFYDLYVIASKTSSLTNIKSMNNKTDHYSLDQNYPNPFNPITTISYSIPEPSFVQMKVYDILGRQVATLISKEQPSGDYKINFDATSLSSGIYIYTITAGQFQESKKLILLR